jgi:hypothetical protein
LDLQGVMRLILSFSTFKEKIEDGTKTQTIRPYNERQFKRFCNAKKYQLYWHNPRNGGKLIREVEPNGTPFLIRFHKKHAIINTGYLPGHNEFIYFPNEQHIIAINDGFERFLDLFSWFYEMYGEEMFTKKFMVLRWKL